MRAAVADSGFVVALLNRRDPDHGRVAAVARSLTVPPWLPSPAVTEICYVLQNRMATAAVARFLVHLATPTAGLAILDPEPRDYQRAGEIVTRYGDIGLDFVDAMVVAVAERLGIRTVLTLDRRHLGVVRPRHCAELELLPE